MSSGFSESTQAAVASARSNTISDMLHRTAARTPDKTAIIDGDVRLTYSKFDAAVNRCTHALTARGLGRGDRDSR